MNTEQDRDNTKLDAGLARLPQWQPPADFTARLAAAAARQAAEPVAVEVPSTRAWLWSRFVHHLPLTLLAGLLALVLAVLPWSRLVVEPAFPWVIAGGAVAAGIGFTLRLLRVA